ncbi:MAG: hypothetical protein JXJ17_05860 [Anaerolineae bacterium]|nr:hypothetical protein [Anaerolineae bacterium]
MPVIWQFLLGSTGVCVLLSSILIFGGGSKSNRVSLGAFIKGTFIIVVPVGLIIGLILYWLRGPIRRLFDLVLVGQPLLSIVIVITLLIMLIAWSIQLSKDSSFGQLVTLALMSVLLAVALVWTINLYFLGSSIFRVLMLAEDYMKYYLYGGIVIVLVFCGPLAQVLYLASDGKTVTRVNIRKPRTQQKYVNAGYSCGRCGKSLPGPVASCPHCGAVFGGTSERYLPGTPSPKETTTERRDLTKNAGFFTGLFLLLNSVYLAAVIELYTKIPHTSIRTIRYLLSSSDSLATFIELYKRVPHALTFWQWAGFPLVNIVTLVMVWFHWSYYRDNHGTIENVEYY